MVILETGEVIQESKEKEIVSQILQILHNQNLTVIAAKHLLDKAKQETEKVRV